MEPRVISAEYDSNDRDNPIWEFRATRETEQYLCSDMTPRAEDTPQDVLQALIRWAESGLLHDATDEPRGLSGTLVMSQEEVFESEDTERCRASSWRGARPMQRELKYHHVFGPGGYNRCIKENTDDVKHSGPHEDEWGNVFNINEDGSGFRTITVRNSIGQ